MPSVILSPSKPRPDRLPRGSCPSRCAASHCASDSTRTPAPPDPLARELFDAAAPPDPLALPLVGGVSKRPARMTSARACFSSTAPTPSLSKYLAHQTRTEDNNNTQRTTGTHTPHKEHRKKQAFPVLSVLHVSFFCTPK